MKILRGTTLALEASDEPLTTCDVHEAMWNGQTSCMADTRRGCHSQDMAHTVRTRQALATRLLHGPKASHAETWPEWTSETDVGQWPPECCCRCLRGLLMTIRPSDGRCYKTFQKWSSRTTGKLRWTMCEIDACRNDLCGQDERDGQHSQRMRCDLWSKCDQQDVALIHGPQVPYAEMWSQ